MKDTLKQLGRLQHFRAARERLSEVEFARAQKSVVEAEAAITRLAQSRQQILAGGREGLLTGEWERWWMAESSDALAERCEVELAALRVECLRKQDVAHGALMVARRETEQAQLLHKNMEERLRAAEVRSAQAASDDRFAGRSHWKRDLAGKRELALMKQH